MTDKALIVPDAARVTTVTPWAQIAGLGSTHHTRYDDAAGSRRVPLANCDIAKRSGAR